MNEPLDKDFKLRVQKVKPDSREDVVLEFVRSGELMPMRQMLVWSLTMCWLPFAYERQEADADLLQKVARDAVYQLERHLDYIRDTFGLERPQPLQNGSSDQQWLRTKPEVSQIEVEEELPGEYDLEALGFNDFDELSPAMFKHSSVNAKVA